MADSFRPSRVLEELANLSLSGRLDEPHARQLEGMLRADAAALRWYRDMISLQVDLRIMMTANRSNEQALAGIESAVKPVVRSREQGATQKVSGGKRPGSRSPVLGFLQSMLHVSGDTPIATALLWMVMALCTGMVLTMIVAIVVMIRGVNVHIDAPQMAGSKEQRAASPKSELSPPSSPLPAPAVVARLIHTADCQWAAGSDAPTEGDDLQAGRKLVLKSGLAELMFQSGARAVLQGPATLEVASKTSALLRQGKVSVTVEVPEARGFEIHTPGMKFTDLGTEFGVLVAKDGMQEVHVFRGRVQAEQADVRDQRSEVRDQDSGLSTKNSILSTQPPLILSANEAIRVEAPDNSGKRSKPFVPIAFDAKQFVRALPRTLDLADVIAGGDGTQQHRERGINPGTGESVETPEASDIHPQRPYSPVPQNPLIDGIFIPAASGPVQLDSAGHAFAGFPHTTGTSFNYLWVFGEQEFLSRVKQSGTSPVLGKEYLKPGHAIVYMHANKGLTFDLAAIRKKWPSLRIARFRGVTANGGRATSGGPRESADIWVFVDGQVRFKKTDINIDDGKFDLDIAIGDSERFLTLVATDAGNGIGNDGILWGDPVLDLVAP